MTEKRSEKTDKASKPKLKVKRKTVKDLSKADVMGGHQPPSYRIENCQFR